MKDNKKTPQELQEEQAQLNVETQRNQELVEYPTLTDEEIEEILQTNPERSPKYLHYKKVKDGIKNAKDAQKEEMKNIDRSNVVKSVPKN